MLMFMQGEIQSEAAERERNIPHVMIKVPVHES